MSRILKISRTLALPLDAVTQTFAILSIRGAGKTNLAACMAEEMFAARLPFCVLDPVGAWYGLRSSRDGRKPGLRIPIFGGRHADVPLERASGVMMADLVASDRLSCVLDVSEFSEGDKTRFLTDFAERLYRKNEEPLHLFLEEADSFVPQRTFRDQARLLGAWQNIVRRGRARGLGITMITQRSAVLNKDVLTQIETLFVLRTTSPQDRKAISAWVDYHGQSRELIDSLPKLENGEAWVWSPSWLKICERVKIRRRRTFDSGATPKLAKSKRPAAFLADVNLESIRKKMADTIERTKVDDPRALHRRIIDLEGKLKATQKVAPAVAPVPAKPSREQIAETKRVAAVVVKQESSVRRLLKLADQLLGGADAQIEKLRKLGEDSRKVSAECAATLARMQARQRPMSTVMLEDGLLERRCRRDVLPRLVGRIDSKLTEIIRRPVRPGATVDGNGSGTLPEGEAKVLKAVAQYGAGGIERKAITIFTGYKRSTRDAYISRLQARGFVRPDGVKVFAEQAGVDHLGDDHSPLPTGGELLDYWRARLPEGERRLLELLATNYPSTVTRDDLTNATGYKRSTRDAYLLRLRSKHLVLDGNAGVVAAAELFD